MISETILKELIEEFSKPREEFDGKSYITRRREWFDEPMGNIRPLLLPHALDNLSLEDAERIYNEMTVGGPKLYPRTYIENGLEKIRESLKYLLYGSDDIAQRFHNFAGNPESEFRLNGVGRAFASTALFLVDHKRYGIWNAAVDGGLKKLGMLPKRKRGAHLGEQYIAIVDALKELQAVCGFQDLSITDEFVELIYHGKIGADKFKGQDKELEKAAEVEETTATSGNEENTHLKNQYLLVKIGLMRGYDVWVANNDRNKSYNGEALASLTLSELPRFAGPNVLRIAKSIDVIWFKRRTDQPVGFFEIEHTSAMYSGLLRLNDVKTDYPIPEAFIVGPKERKALFESQIQRRTFTHSELSEVCQFLSYEDLAKLRQSYETISTILP
jgi:hypothetical protein